METKFIFGSLASSMAFEQIVLGSYIAAVLEVGSRMGSTKRHLA